jgi:uncharacterized membrane protein YraQ (UPF0718 family)
LWDCKVWFDCQINHVESAWTFSTPNEPGKETNLSLRPSPTLLGISLVALVLAALAWHSGGIDLALTGLIAGGKTLLGVIPLLLAAFAITGFLQVLVPQEQIERLLGSAAGWRGILLACLAGGLIPGGPYAYYPIAAALLHSGAGLGAIVAFVTAKNMWSLSRLPMEFALLGPRLTISRYLITLLVPPIMGLLTETLLGRQIIKIREASR